MFRHSLLILLGLICSSCAYQFGYHSRQMPGGYSQVSVPVFANFSQEVGAEAYFTNALRREFERSRVATVTDKNTAPIILQGSIRNVVIAMNSQVAANDSNKDLKYLPQNTVINNTYRLIINIDLELVRASDKKVIWQQNFSNVRVYNSAQVSIPTLNSVNPLYNNSAKHQNMKLLASIMMKEAHDRLTEKF